MAVRGAMVAGLLLLGACGGGSGGSGSGAQPPAQGGRVLGLDVKEVPTVPYATAYDRAMTLGVREVSVALDWAALEPTVGNYDNSLPAIIDVFYPGQPGDLALVLRPLDTPGPSLPADLAGRAFDDPVVIAAFDAFLVNLHGQLGALNASGRLKWIHVGNEVDAYLGGDAARWAQWTAFFNAARTRIEALWGPGVVVSSIVQFSALQNSAVRGHYLALLPALDSAVLTYYPLNADFTVRPTTDVAADFDLMAGTLAGAPILLQECGYPSSTVNNSSEAQQAAFVSAVFRAWDAHRDRIRLVDFTWQYDVSQAAVDQWVIDFGMAGQPAEDAFRQYLASLGLNNHDGTEKAAMQRLRDELRARAWAP